MLTNAAASDKIDISEDDITINVIGEKMPESKNALTEAVYYTLLALFQPLHGYGVMQKVASLSAGRVNLGAGTLYGALNTLVGKGWIEALSVEPKDRKKEYVITELGKAVVKQETKRLEELAENGKRVLRGESE